MVTKENIENIQIDHGIIFLNYGEENEKELAPVKGGGTFTAERNIRDIEFDGKQGKTVGTRVIDEQNATLKVVILDSSIENIKLALPGADLTENKITNSVNGIIPSTDYAKNVTMFAKTVAGIYKKIVLYNVMADNGLSFAATPKAEGGIELAFAAHWDLSDTENKLYSIEDVESIN